MLAHGTLSQFQSPLSLYIGHSSGTINTAIFSRFISFFFYAHANPLHDFSVEILMFLTATTVTNPEMLAIIIYYILELTSKYSLNIFQLSVNITLKPMRHPWVHFIS